MAGEVPESTATPVTPVAPTTTPSAAETAVSTETSQSTETSESTETSQYDSAVTSLFGEKAPTEAELMGEDIATDTETPKPEDAKTATEAKTETKPTESAEQKSAEAASKTDDKSAEASDGKTPPKGFVPHAALHEERVKRQEVEKEKTALALENDRLRRENDILSQLPVTTETDVPKDFKVLTETEEDALMNEDLVAYQRYQRNLRRYNDTQAAVKGQEIREASVVESSLAAMMEVVPGLFDEGNDVNNRLSAFANENGLPPAVLGILTNPKTKIIQAGQKQPILLGRSSVAVVKFLNNAFQKAAATKGTDEASLRESIEAELKTKLTEEITKEVMSKLKNTTPEFRSISDVPGSGETPTGSALTEADFRNMDEKATRAALGG